MYEQLNAYFETILSEVQCDFRKGCNVQYCLIVLIKKYCKFLNKVGFSCILMTDLSKAFECIDHELLIAKMHGYVFDVKSSKFTDS